MDIYCFNCNQKLDLEAGTKVVRGQECPHCYARLRSCKMCQFFDQSAYNECKEPSADRIVEKENANFCDYYFLKGSSNDNNEQGIDAANALFKS